MDVMNSESGTDPRLKDGTSTLELLNRAGNAIAAGLDIENLVQLVVDVGTELSGADYGAFFYSRNDTPEIDSLACALSGASPNAFAQLPPLRTFDGEAIVRSDDIQNDVRYGRNTPFHGHRSGGNSVRSYLAVPVRSRDQEVLGLLLFGHSLPGVFTARAERAVVNIAALAAVALDNARLYRATQSQMDERIRAQAALRESEAKFRAITDTMPQIVWSSQSDGTDDYYNSRWYEYTGLPADSHGEECWTLVLHPDDRERAWNLWLDALARGAPYEDEYRLRRHDGNYRWVLERAMPVHDDATGRIVRWLGTCTDIDDQVRARSSLAIDNDELERQVDQRTVQLADTTVRLRTEVRERERAEEALRQAQKMEALGQLTGGVAHDFNNLLTVVMGNLETLQRRLRGGQPDVEQLLRIADNASRGAERAATLTQQLLAFARRQPLAPTTLDINRLVADMSDLLRRTLGEQIALDTSLADDLWMTQADRNQLENAMLNLAVNARDAMPRGGRLIISTFNQVVDEAYASSHPDIASGVYAVIAVTDTGAGMSAEVRSHAIEPFFTTKPVGSGTGLGLSQVYGFLKQTGGHLKIESVPDAGTTVSLLLPRLIPSAVDVSPQTVRPPDLAGSIRGANELILVVEDDQDVRIHSTASLRELGYRVLAASDADAALEILEQNPDIALLFTDIGLPGRMNGRELADTAMRRSSGAGQLKILFTSAYPRDAIMHDGKLDAGVRLISKPFTYASLGTKVRETIDDHAGDAGRNAAPTRILIVEDEILVRMFAVDALAEAGFEVEEADNGAQALACLSRLKDEIGAVIIDLGLPDRPGDQIAAEMRALRGDLPILIASGRSEKELRERFALDGRVNIIVKPFTGPMLIHALETLGIAVPSQ